VFCRSWQCPPAQMHPCASSKPSSISASLQKMFTTSLSMSPDSLRTTKLWATAISTATYVPTTPHSTPTPTLSSSTTTQTSPRDSTSSIIPSQPMAATPSTSTSVRNWLSQTTLTTTTHWTSLSGESSPITQSVSTCCSRTMDSSAWGLRSLRSSRRRIPSPFCSSRAFLEPESHISCCLTAARTQESF